MTGNDGKEEVESAALHAPAEKDRIDPASKRFSGKSFFNQYQELCKHGFYLYPCKEDAAEKYLRFPHDKSEDWLRKHSWSRDSAGRWRLHVNVKHLRWLADGAGAVKQSSKVGHSHQRDLSVFCPISRDERHLLRSSGMRRLRFGCFVGVSASVQNHLFKLCKTAKDRDILASLTGIKGQHKWHCKEVSGDGGAWSDGLWHAFTTGAKKIVALFLTLMRSLGLLEAWKDHCHKCCGKVGGNWGHITYGTGLIQLCGCNGGKIRDLCCMDPQKLFTCTCPDCVKAVKKAGGHVENGTAYFLPPQQLKHVTHLLTMFKEMWHTCKTLDYEEFLRRRVYLRVQASSFVDHIATIFGPDAVTPKFASMEHLLPQIAHALPETHCAFILLTQAAPTEKPSLGLHFISPLVLVGSQCLDLHCTFL